VCDSQGDIAVDEVCDPTTDRTPEATRAYQEYYWLLSAAYPIAHNSGVIVVDRRASSRRIRDNE